MTALEREDHNGGDQNDQSGRDRQRQPVALLGIFLRNQFKIGTSVHERILHPHQRNSQADAVYEYEDNFCLT